MIMAIWPIQHLYRHDHERVRQAVHDGDAVYGTGAVLGQG
jgi:hypothetical protein